MVTCRGLLVGLLFVTAACSSSSTSKTPEGFTVFNGKGYRLAHPSDWEERTGDRLLVAKREVEFVNPATLARLPSLVGVSANATDLPLETYIGLFYETSKEGLRQFELKNRERAVPGAKEARMLEISYLDETRGSPVPARAWALVARSRGGRIFNLQAGGSGADFDEKVFGQILDSFKLE
jgi:hypothetical protein